MRSAGRGLGAAFVLAALLTSAAHAQDDGGALGRSAGCNEPGAVVTVEGVGRAVYGELRTDDAAGRAELYGGVCVQAMEGGWVLRAESVLLLDLRGDDPRVEAGDPSVLFGPWAVEGRELVGRAGGVEVEDAIITRPGVEAHAARAFLQGDTAVLEDVTILTENYTFRAERGELEGTVLRLVRAGGTSCTCGPELYRVDGDELIAEIARGELRVEAPVVTVLGVAVPLGRAFTIEDAGRDLRPPVVVEARDGLGTVVATRGLQAGPVDLEMGASSQGGVRPVLDLSATRPQARARLQADRQGVRIDSRLDRPLASGLTLELLQEHDLRRADPPRLRSGARLRYGRSLALGPARVDVEALAGAELAAEPEAGGGGPAGPRLPASLALDLRGPEGPVGRGRLRAEGAVNAYPGLGPAAWTGRLAPSWRFGREARTLTIGADRRWTAGESPFAFDATRERFRLRADGRADLGAVRLDAEAVYRLPPEAAGFEALGASAEVGLPLGDGWRLAPRLEAELAGLAGGPEADDWVQLSLPATGSLPAGEATFGVRWRQGLAPVALRDLELSAEAPIRLGTGVHLRPFLAVDVAPLLAEADGAVLAGHGLSVTLAGCCGELDLGYRVEDGTWNVEVGARLPTLTIGEPGAASAGP